MGLIADKIRAYLYLLVSVIFLACACISMCLSNNIETALNQIHGNNIETALNQIQCNNDEARIIYPEERVKQYQSVSRGVVEEQSAGVFSTPAYGRISSGYGMRDGKFHQGIDIAANHGDNIYAAEEGTVVFAEYYGGYGKLIEIQHKDNIVTLYAHCSKMLVREGQRVNRQQIIGQVGNSGNSRGSHLHFEVKKDGIPQNPENYLR